MDAKDLAALMLKVVGLFMLAYAVFEIPYYFPPYLHSGDYSFIESFMQAAATVTLPIVFGLLLWFFPANVANRMVSGAKLSDERFGLPEFERLALTVIGVWLTAYGIADLVYGITNLLALRMEYPELGLWSRYMPGLVSSGSKVLLGVGLAVGAKGIRSLLKRVRGEG